MMSDKALVKQLRKELTRLESRLKTTGSISVAGDAAALLREKDLLIEKVNAPAIFLKKRSNLHSWNN